MWIALKYWSQIGSAIAGAALAGSVIWSYQQGAIDDLVADHQSEMTQLEQTIKDQCVAQEAKNETIISSMRKELGLSRARFYDMRMQLTKMLNTTSGHRASGDIDPAAGAGTGGAARVPIEQLFRDYPEWAEERSRLRACQSKLLECATRESPQK